MGAADHNSTIFCFLANNEILVNLSIQYSTINKPKHTSNNN